MKLRIAILMWALSIAADIHSEVSANDSIDEDVEVSVEEGGVEPAIDFEALKASLDEIPSSASDMSYPVLPGSETTTNAVAECLLDRAIGSVVDNFPEDGDAVLLSDRIAYSYSMMTWEGFLGDDETNGWTRVAKKQCFDWYLNRLATNSCTGISTAVSNYVRRAIVQCRELNYTNSWPSLRAICRNETLPHRSGAGVLSVRYSPVDNDLVNFALEAATNAMIAPFPVWMPVLSECMERFCALAPTDSYRTNFATRVSCLRAETMETAQCYDNFYLESFPDYASSSNRLMLALRALAPLEAGHDEDETKTMRDNLEEYFAPITNQLMNAAQPLPEVEALRGL